jgi:hypothetical protein
MSDFKVGQRVWSFLQDWGTVDELRDDLGEYYVGVKFDNGEYLFYTPDGRWSSEEKRSLFFREITVPSNALVPPVEYLSLKKGDVVYFKDGDFGYVESTSGSNEPAFTYHGAVPQKLDDAFSVMTTHKSSIKKVVGNIYD